jgi:predicted metal-dependent hydrolase
MDEAIRTLHESNARLAEAVEMLRRTRREVEAIHAEASRLYAETMRKLEALIAWLEGRGGEAR